LAAPAVDESYMLSCARELTEAYFCFDDASIPIDLEFIASLRGVKVEYKDMEETIAGQLISRDGIVVAQVNQRHLYSRQRFTLAHEIGHTFFPGFSRHKVFRQELNKCWLSERRHRNREEYLCDLFASELILPRSQVTRMIKPGSAALDNLLLIAEEFRASLEATSMKFPKLYPDPLVVWVTEVNLSERDTGRKLTIDDGQALLFDLRAPRPRPKVKMVARSITWRHGYIKRGRSVPRRGSIELAYLTGNRINAIERLKLKSFDEDLYRVDTYPYTIGVGGTGSISKAISVLQPISSTLYSHIV